MLVDHLQKTKKEYENLKNSRFRRFTIYLEKTCFQHDMAYGDFKDLTRRTGSDKILHNKAFSIGKNPKCDGYQRRPASMVYKFFDKKTAGGELKMKLCLLKN